MELLKIDTSEHTIVFDRGCNSKKNLEQVNDLNLHYIGALTPSHHKDLLKTAEGKFVAIFCMFLSQQLNAIACRLGKIYIFLGVFFTKKGGSIQRQLKEMAGRQL